MERDDTKIAALFSEKFNKTTRPRAAIKARIVKLREDAAVCFSNITQASIESSGFLLFIITFGFYHFILYLLSSTSL